MYSLATFEGPGEIVVGASSCSRHTYTSNTIPAQHVELGRATKYKPWRRSEVLVVVVCDASVKPISAAAADYRADLAHATAYHSRWQVESNYRATSNRFEIWVVD